MSPEPLWTAVLLGCAAVTLVGCPQVIWVGEPPATTDDDSTLGPADDDGDDDDSTATACLLAVPDHVDLPQPGHGNPGLHAYLASPGWPLGLAFASAAWTGLEDDGWGLQLDPSLLWALAIERTAMGCDANTPEDEVHIDEQWPRDASTDAGGCFGIDASPVWALVCDLFPERFACEELDRTEVVGTEGSAGPGRDRVSAGAVVVAHYLAGAVPLLSLHGIPDPPTWIAQAADPLAWPKIAAALHTTGPEDEAWDDLQDCASAPLLELCLPALQGPMVRVAANTQALRAAALSGPCAQFNLSVSAQEDFFRPLERLWEENEDAGEGLDEAASQGAAAFVAAAIEAMGAEIRCPASSLEDRFGASCP